MLIDLTISFKSTIEVVEKRVKYVVDIILVLLWLTVNIDVVLVFLLLTLNMFYTFFSLFLLLTLYS